MTRVIHLVCAVSGLRKLKVDGLVRQTSSSRTCCADDCGGGGADSAALCGCTRFTAVTRQRGAATESQVHVCEPRARRTVTRKEVEVGGQA